MIRKMFTIIDFLTCMDCEVKIEMIRIEGGRCTGKTTKLIELALENNFATIVVPTYPCVGYVNAMIRDMGYEGFSAITFDQFIKDRSWNYSRKYVIDELDACLKNCGVIGYTNFVEEKQMDMNFEVKHVGTHYELYVNGNFNGSYDNVREAAEEIERINSGEAE